MHPVGPLLFAESEARTLHETLWWIRRKGMENELFDCGLPMSLACAKAASRLGGFCHLINAASTLALVATAINNPTCAEAGALDETILYVGRLAGWLDLHIPWNDFNTALRKARNHRLVTQKEPLVPNNDP